ncbi:tRNA (adenosine(37)-N6)-dimethylallyltransferase MiaA [Leptospira ilyithenensis]|uniref:tRNA dimethylallyltransferase n=1 Tax=Leptospira ilyithenensis TaxID=2484901 RepID=A0A4R9LJ08_9LEPT|nr:tRNA (adenosine(37)-N6)-dimethylallyltransferase MiaA [Leptospira ilyithenensis]TGN06803.1 tRNA (adenosine(37)-N6)-dimethylallyltransferase MiaA [Leptospira ilyithenensis]
MILPILAGPTGSGKTSLTGSLDPNRFEVVSFDSRQVYSELAVGTTSPTKEERDHIPHWVVGILTADKSPNAKQYSTWARDAILSIWNKNKTPFLVCGTGFYLRAFLMGMFPVPNVPQDTKDFAQNLPLSEAVLLLKEKDPKAFRNISETDGYRIRRALEVVLTGVLWSEVSSRTTGGFLEEFPDLKPKAVWLDWPRADLYARIETRVPGLLKDGMLEESKLVLEKYGPDCPGLHSLGYNFALDFLYGKIDFNTLLERLAQSHRNYAKRQITWFRKDPLLVPMSWDSAFKEFTKID